MVSPEEILLRRIESILAGMEHRLQSQSRKESDQQVTVNVPEVQVSIGDVAALQQGAWDVFITPKQSIGQPFSEETTGIAALGIQSNQWQAAQISPQGGWIVHPRPEHIRCFAYSRGTPALDKQYLAIWNGGNTHLLIIHRVLVAPAAGGSGLPIASPVHLVLAVVDAQPPNTNPSENPVADQEGYNYATSGIKVYKNLTQPAYLNNAIAVGHATISNRWEPTTGWVSLYEPREFLRLELPRADLQTPVYYGIVVYQENSTSTGEIQVWVEYEIVEKPA